VSDGPVARAFAAAADYDSHARVQRLAARDLARRIAALPLPPQPRVLEIGCGTGFLTQALRDEGLGGDWLITDIAPAMLERARTRLRDDNGASLTFAQLDGEHDEPPGGPFDLICASLATQWFADEPAALTRWREWLSPDGHIMVATLGPGTFAEWRSAHDLEGLTAGTLGFTPLAELQALEPRHPLTIEHYRERHADARAFLHALRAIGAQTASAGHRPLSPGALRRVMRRFEADGAIASYEVVTCHVARANRPA
jgi:malonyl-CoA O-methyltransferase